MYEERHCPCGASRAPFLTHATFLVVDSISNKRKVISRARRDVKNGGKLKLGVQSPKMIVDAPLYLKKVRVRATEGVEGGGEGGRGVEVDGQTHSRRGLTLGVRDVPSHCQTQACWPLCDSLRSWTCAVRHF